MSDEEWNKITDSSRKGEVSEAQLSGITTEAGLSMHLCRLPTEKPVHNAGQVQPNI